MLSKKYSLQCPSDVRELLRLGSDVHMMLALIYKVNDLQAKAGYAYQQHKKCRTAEIKIRWFQDYAALRIKRLAMSEKLKQLTKLKGLAVNRQMGGRVRSVYSRLPARGQPRPSGGLASISQKGLFLFSDMYTEEALLNLIVNETMFREEAP